LTYFYRFQEADCPGIDPVTRTNSKGPLDSHELEAAASGETSHVGVTQSQFQLGQRPAIGDKSLLAVGTSSTPSSKSYSGEDPKTDKLSSSSSSSSSSSNSNYRPAKPDGNSDDNKNSSANAFHATKLWEVAAFLVILVVTSNKYFTC